eukprot:scaffold102018_cov48-Phaeocystis_antarctica.AAC.1
MSSWRTSSSCSVRGSTTQRTSSSCSVSSCASSSVLASAKLSRHGRSTGRFIAWPNLARERTHSSAGRRVSNTKAFGLAHQKSRKASAEGRSTSAPTEGGRR